MNNKFAPAARAGVLSDRNTSANPANPLSRSYGTCPDQSSRKIDGNDKETIFDQSPHRVTRRVCDDRALIIQYFAIAMINGEVFHGEVKALLDN